MTEEFSRKVGQLQGPILVLGASGFVGANLFRSLLAVRHDVYGTTSSLSAWRLEGIPAENLFAADLLVEHNLVRLIETVRPRTVFDCVAYGAYPCETDADLMVRTNVSFAVRLIELLRQHEVARYIHAGSQSEYGDNAAGTLEDAPLTPNSHHSASKAAASGLVHYYGKHLRFPCANLRLYSAFGPLEDSSRLMPTLIAHGVRGTYPPFVSPQISRDFLYIDDACEAFVDAALNLPADRFGESFNIGSGVKTTIAEMAALAQKTFGIAGDPQFTLPDRAWDISDWYANPAKARTVLGWKARTPLAQGLASMVAWYRGLKDPEQYRKSSKQFGADEVHSVSAIVACYRDGQAIPIMCERLTKVLGKLNIGYEIIFVNDSSPDDSEEIIRGLSARDRHVIGITHSRNFGSQAAFRSGMEVASKNACVLLDGDLQDPPELIEEFVAKWREGYEVVYGRRVKREAPFHMRLAYKAFYRVFAKLSDIPIPYDAGDFSLMDKQVVRSLLTFPERDLFLRGVRAFAGFRQTGVDYVRPARRFGVTTNSLVKNIDWAKRGVLSFSGKPLSVLSTFGVLLFLFSLFLIAAQTASRLLFPELAPRGITTTLLFIIFFGSINFFALGIIGEYIAKIMQEVKKRPHFIRRHIVRDGEIRDAVDEHETRATRRQGWS